jgi:hypothetical protein
MARALDRGIDPERAQKREGCAKEKPHLAGLSDDAAETTSAATWSPATSISTGKR